MTKLITNYKLQAYKRRRDLKAPAAASARNGFTSKCASLVKEQRARLYILRRCATMLLCWYIQDHGDD